MSFAVSPWQVIKDSSMRIAIGLAIDFLLNIISVFVQIHFYDISMQKVGSNYWPRHVTANASCASVYCRILAHHWLVSSQAENTCRF